MQKNTSTEERRNDFIHWTQEQHIISAEVLNDDLLNRSLRKIMDNISIYSIDDESKIRDIVIKFIDNRVGLSNINFHIYNNNISHLLAYAEYLKTKFDTKNILDKKNIPFDLNDKLYASLTVAYCLSRVDNRAVDALGFKSFTSAFKGIGEILGQKSSTIKNMRDEFDPYFNNGRRGWYQRELRSSRKEVFDYFSDIADDKIIEITKNILQKSQPIDNMHLDNHIQHLHNRIKLNSNKMKEIHIKRKLK